jgi:rhamnosyltransferase
MANSVCAIIVTYRVGRDVLRGFESIRGQVQETVFVDNGGDSETVAVLQEIERTHADVKVFYNGQNAGIAAAFNTGVRYALQKQHRWVLTLDDDSEATQGMVNGLIGAYRMLNEAGTGRVGIVAAEMIDRNVPNSATHTPRDNAVQEVTTCISSGSLIDCKVFAEVGFFNEPLFLYYVDDDFCLRCADRGWKVYVCRTARLLHSEGFRQQRSFLGRPFIYRNYGSPARYYMARNAVYMLKKHRRHGRYCRNVVKRIASDIVTTLLFGRRRWTLIRSMLTGFGHGLVGRYGKWSKSES